MRSNQVIQTALLSLVISIVLTFVSINVFKLGTNHLKETGRIHLFRPKSCPPNQTVYVERLVPAAPSSPPPPPPPLSPPPLPEDIRNELSMNKIKSDLSKWIRHLRKQESGIYSQRTACREMEAKGQTCTYEGVLCMNVSSSIQPGRPRVYFVDDNKTDFSDVPTDNWCGYRWKSADPKYYSTRHWPPMENTVIAQQSCMEAWYRTSESIFGKNDELLSRVKWIPPTAILDFDFLENDHNGHFASDTLWLLDAMLFQESLDLRTRPGYRKWRAPHDDDTTLLSENFKIYVPNSWNQFQQVMSRDVNRLLFASILRKNLRNLYNMSDDELHNAPEDETVQRPTENFFLAYPEMRETLQFHGDLINNPDVDLVCTPKLTAGFKTGFSVHERVCRDIRTRAFELYDIKRPEMEALGQIVYPQPPKSILILNRHITREIGNGIELYKALKKEFEPQGVNVTYKSTINVDTAEQFVRTYSSYGVIISPHGSQNMAQMWMQRYAALIEVMPVGYTEHSFSMLSVPCKTWFYEFQSSSIKEEQAEYEKLCGHKVPHMFDPCLDVKSKQVWVNVTKMIPVVKHALERLGYHTGQFWFEDLYSRKEPL